MSIYQDFRLAISSGRNVVSVQCQLPERCKVIESIAKELGLLCYLWNLGQKRFRAIGSHQDLELEAVSPLDALVQLEPGFITQGVALFWKIYILSYMK